MRARRVNASQATRFRQAPHANAYSLQCGSITFPIGGLDRAQTPWRRISEAGERLSASAAIWCCRD